MRSTKKRHDSKAIRQQKGDVLQNNDVIGGAECGEGALGGGRGGPARGVGSPVLVVLFGLTGARGGVEISTCQHICLPTGNHEATLYMVSKRSQWLANAGQRQTTVTTR